MGLMFIVGYILIITAFILYFIKKLPILKRKDIFLTSLVVSLTIVGIYYIAVAISQGDPYITLLWLLGVILAVLLTGLGNDIYSYIKTGGKVRDYYSSLKENRNHESFKFEEKDFRKKLKESCPILNPNIFKKK